MKVKLLKKIRKRFIFFYDRDENFINPWKVFDKERNEQCHFFRFGISYYSEQACYEMMDRLGILTYWSRIYDRKEARRINKVRNDQVQVFRDYDSKMKNRS